YASTPTTNAFGVRGPIAIIAATAANNVPEPKYAHHRPTRSAIEPPSAQPIVLKMPFITPVARATVSAEAFQSGPTAGHKPIIAAAPIGDATSTITNSATG